MLKFRGSQNFRQRIVFATLSGKAIRIDGIRESSDNPGLHDYEANFLRLVEKVTNGCQVEINETGTSLKYRPGLISGGRALSHDCGLARSMGYFLEPLLCLSLFGKKAVSITLSGVTNDPVDPCVDTFRTVTLPLLRTVGVQEGLELRIVRRGAKPLGGGQVVVSIPVVRSLKPVHLLDAGLVKRVRGVAYSTRCSPQTANRMVDACREVFNPLLPDVYIFTDHAAGAQAALSPGFGVCLLAETTTGCILSAQTAAQAKEGTPAVPEEVGLRGAQQLLAEVQAQGVVDSAHQGLLLFLAAMGPEEVMKMRLGKLTPHAILTLRHLKTFFGVTFNLKSEMENGTVLCSTVGANLCNIARSTT
mmetsp:Transcript_26188/g.36162  ORF Transcript_26188/g.36162 Transcript_26188/m.36162 type:complete len:361 (+) Transcript_26188:211-1293(+)|eukprot:CAMPEP_0196588140 /NCGR_PEP_ID=MMETSP1081-20130531/59685_1 /TAXON_ID=36882 /ORGANISM="Pyramimonas amylifera, Strain CCMP720" /LENGTH=360 /DNA_ID=CAMNT_0041910559 /DNA_START=207 /DNA_END=1289 /DNA_ORIENTATION=+